MRSCSTANAIVSVSLAALLLSASWISGQPPHTDPRKPVLNLTSHSADVYTVAFSADGKRLASGSNQQVKVWDLSTGQELFSFPIKGTNVYGLAFSPDGKQLAFGLSKSVKLLDAETGKETLALGGAAHFVFRMAFSPDGKQLTAACGSTNNLGDVCIWEAATGKLVHCLTGHKEAVLNVAYSRDGQRLATSSGGTTATKAGQVKVWEASTGRELLSLAAATDNVYGVALSPDGRRLASCSGVRGATTTAGSARLWEVLSGQEVLRLNGHTGTIYSIVFSPDGQRLATCGQDKTVRLWDVLTGQEIVSLDAHTGWVYSVAFSSDGQRLATASQDKSVKVWDVSTFRRDGRAAAAPLTDKELTTLWSHLAATDAGQAFRALGRLVAAPEQTVAFLRTHVAPTAALTGAQQRQLAQWLGDLDDERFEVRSKASGELLKLGEAALPALRQAQAATASAEVRSRIEVLLDRLTETALTPERLANLRALEVLETIGTAEAQEVLKRLAGGLSEARLTREASAALQRLTERSSSPATP